MKKEHMVTNISTNTLWCQLLEIKKSVEQSDQDTFSVFFNQKTGLLLTESSEEGSVLIYTFDTKTTINSCQEASPYKFINKGIKPAIGHCTCSEFIKLYLPYCFLYKVSKILKRAISVSHFAQTLDGKIATNSGSSKWIGNEENLIHSHRMRALCNGILVGRKTIELDHPRLNVRHCEGENPKKIALGNKSIGNLKQELFGNEFIEITSEERNCTNHIKTNKNTDFDGLTILNQLYEKNIYSVFIEGGSKTSSAFLNSNSIDEVQLHISPIILGSGISNFQLTEAENISDGIQFEVFDFVSIGNAIMFKGEPVSK